MNLPREYQPWLRLRRSRVKWFRYSNRLKTQDERILAALFVTALNEYLSWKNGTRSTYYCAVCYEDARIRQTQVCCDLCRELRLLTACRERYDDPEKTYNRVLRVYNKKLKEYETEG